MEEQELTGKIISKFYKVYNTLGYGFIESIYHNAMILELVSDGFSVDTEKSIAVHYEGRVVGTFCADLVIENRVIVELKAKERLIEAHEAQLTNYLRATEIEIGLLFNFGKSPEFKRKFFSNANKQLSEKSLEASILNNLFSIDPLESA
jgi:GxxExxY protein